MDTSSGRYIKTITKSAPALARVELSDGVTQDITLPAGADNTTPGPQGPASTQPGPVGRGVQSVAMISPTVARQTFTDGGILDFTIPAGAPGVASTQPGPKGPDSTQPGPLGAAGRGVQSVQMSGSNDLLITYTDGTTSTIPLPASLSWTPNYTSGNFAAQIGAASKALVMSPVHNKTFTYASGNTGIMLKANTMYAIRGFVGAAGNAQLFFNHVDSGMHIEHTSSFGFNHQTGAADELLEIHIVPVNPNPTVNIVAGSGYYQVMEYESRT